MRCIGDIVLATTRPGSTLRRFRRQHGRAKIVRIRYMGRRDPRRVRTSARAMSWPRSIGVPVVSPTRIWICSSRSTAFTNSSSLGLIAHTCVEATVRYAAELGYEVTVVKDATASYSEEHMHAALEVNLPNYANAIVTTRSCWSRSLASQTNVRLVRHAAPLDSIASRAGLLGETVVVIGGSAGIGLDTARHGRAAGAEVLLRLATPSASAMCSRRRSVVGRVRPGVHAADHRWHRVN